MFEPFWPYRVKAVGHFHTQQYLRPDNTDQLYYDTAHRILSGRIRDPWIDKYHRRYFADMRLIKDVRANLLLKWLHRSFPELPIILLVRHPCAVVRSQLRRTDWQPDLVQEFLDQDLLVGDYLRPFEGDIRRADNHFDRLVFRWCIQNYVPLQQFTGDEIFIAFYENFCVDPSGEVERMFGYLGKPYDGTILSKLDRPSPVSHQGSAIVSGGSFNRQLAQKYITRANT